MEIYLILPREPIRLEDRAIIFDTEGDLRRIRLMPPLGEGAEIREVRYYPEKNGRMSYTIQDWTKDKKSIIKTQSLFAEDLYK